MQRLIERRLGELPAVMPLGSPQVGKTTLANAIGVQHPGARALDLERASLQQPELFFAALRPEIDADRRAGRLLVLSSASGALLRQSSESLAGRVAYLELAQLLAAEPPVDGLTDLQRLWRRGGFPTRYLVRSGEG